MAEGEAKVRFTQEGAEGVQRALGLIQEQFKKVQEAFQQGATAAQGMGGVVQALSGALSAAATPVGQLTIAIGAMIATFEKAANTAETLYRQIRQLTATTGLGVEEAQALTGAFELMGLESGTLDRVMFRLGAEIESGGKRLAGLGISTKDAQGNLRSTGEVFLEVSRTLGSMGNETERNARLAELFGARLGRELVQSLAQGGQALDAYMEKAREIGGLTEADATQTREFIQVKAELAARTQELWIAISRIAVPVLKTLTEALLVIGSAVSAVVRGIRDWIGQLPEWVQYMLPFVGQVKLLADLFRGFRAVVEYFRPPPIPAGAAPAAPPGAPQRVETAEDVRFQMKMNEERLRLEERFVIEQARLETGSQAEAIRRAQEFLDQRLTIEREGAKRLLEDPHVKVTDPEERLKIQRELMQKEVQIEGERRLLILREREAEAADAKRLLADQLKERKLAADEEVALVRVRREEELTRLQELGLSVDEVAEKRLRIETSAAEETARVRKATIDEEIAGLRQLALQYVGQEALQRDVNNRIIELTHQRTMVELESVAQVEKARADAARAEEDRQQKAAGFFPQLIKMAQDYATYQGRATITVQDMDQAFTQATKNAAAGMASFFAGAQMSPEAIQQFLQVQQLAGGMRREGIAPGQVTTAAEVEAFRGFGPDFLQQLGLERIGAGMPEIGQMLTGAAARFEEQEALARRGEAAGIAARAGIDIGPTMRGLREGGEAAVKKIVDEMPPVLEGLFEQFADNLIRKLEIEARRN